MTTSWPGGPLRERPFRLYFVAQSLSAIGSSLVPVALALTVLEVTGSPTALGIVVAAPVVPQLLLLLAGGVLADRLERRRLLVLCNAVMAVSQLGTALLLIAGTASGSLSIPALLATQVLFGGAKAFSSPALIGVVADLVDSEDRQAAQALMSMTKNSARIVGPLIAGVLVALDIGAYALAIDSVSYVAAAFLLSRIPATSSPVRPSSDFISELKEGWRTLTSKSWVWSMILSFSFYQGVVLPSLLVGGPLLAVTTSLGRHGWAAVLSAQGVGAVLGGAVLLRWRPRRPLIMSTLLVSATSAQLVALASLAPLSIVVVLSALASAAVVSSDTLWLSTLQREVPPHQIARISSYDWLGSLAFNPVGLAVMGVLLTHVDPRPILLTVAGLNLAVRAAVLVPEGVRGITQERPPATALE